MPGGKHPQFNALFDAVWAALEQTHPGRKLAYKGKTHALITYYCASCGAKMRFFKRHANRKYCDACRELRKRATVQRYWEHKREALQ